MVTAAVNLKDACFVEEKLRKPRQCIKKQGYYFFDKGPYSQSYGFSSSHIWMWELDHKEGWVLRTDSFDLCCWRRLDNLLYSKEIKPVNPKGNQPWIFTGRADVEAEAPIFWPPDAKNLLIRKGSDTGKDWSQEEKREIEDVVVGWYHRQWTWIWANSGRHWRTKEPHVLQSMGSQRIGHDFRTEQQQILYINVSIYHRLLIHSPV